MIINRSKRAVSTRIEAFMKSAKGTQIPVRVFLNSRSSGPIKHWEIFTSSLTNLS